MAAGCREAPTTPKGVKPISTDGVTFLGAKTGEAEIELMKRLQPCLTEFKDVQAAYLLRGKLASGEQTVFLGISNGQNPDPRLMAAVHEIFHGYFASSQHLDIVFLTSGEETRAMAVADPFYVRQ
ncbi:MAG: hypothetical protein HONBIEJF_00375 [Fimbriimonadaceae bacterium]|nr:hypothetical protein [Fimbriimonadaceae bacterium]